MHAYDFSALGRDVVFEEKECNEEFSTLLDQKINLTGKNCVFTSQKKIINLAVEIGGKSTACKKNTKLALIECANFSPESIIGKSLKYNVNSDAAYKFERGIDPCIQENALRRLIRVIEEHTHIKDVSFIKYESLKFEERAIRTDYKEINKILGSDISNSSFEKKLKKLKFQCGPSIKVPAHRNDIFSKNDIAEEIARLIGYDNIKDEAINIEKTNVDTFDKYFFLRNLLVKNGFNEVINYPFIGNVREDSISIDNPIDSNKGFMRTRIRESLIDNLLYNERRQKDSIKLFEFSDIYTSNSTKKKIGIIASGRCGYNHEEFSKQIDKSYLECIFDNTDIEGEFSFELIDRKNLDTKVKSKIYYAEVELGNTGNMPFLQDDRYIDSFFFNKYKPISEFPSSSRDFSFSLEDSSNLEIVLKELSNMEHPNLKMSFIFDFYKNNNKEEIKLGFRMIFQSENKTLSDGEINEYVTLLLKPILKLEGVTIPVISK